MHFYDKEMYLKLKRKSQITKNFKKGIENNELRFIINLNIIL